MDIHDTLQEATSLLEAGRSRAFGAGVVVDRDRLMQLLQHAQEVLPEEILAGASILAQRSQIVAAAQEEAEQIRRTGKSRHRPLLNDGNPAEILEQLMQVRDPQYREIADIIVETDKRQVPAVTREVKQKLEAPE